MSKKLRSTVAYDELQFENLTDYAQELVVYDIMENQGMDNEQKAIEIAKNVDKFICVSEIHYELK